MTRSRKCINGFTLFELVVATSILTVVLIAVYMSLNSISRTVEVEDAILVADQHANNALEEITQLLQSAVLPFTPFAGSGIANPQGVGNPPGSPTAEETLKGFKRNLFAIIDDATNGFNNANGVAWRNALIRGVDTLAFAVPVDAEWDGDFIDDAGRFELGQIAPGRISVGSNFGSNGSLNFVLSDTEPINAVAAIDPDLLNSAIVENDATYNFATSTGIHAAGVAWPAVTAFTVIRFIPLLDSGTPVTINEATLNYDLDGNGLSNDVFEIGWLEVVYPGGFHNVQERTENTLPVPTNGSQQLVKPLTGSYVLRKQDRSAPIFRLVHYDSGNITNTGFIDRGSGNGDFAIQVRLLMFESEGIANLVKTNPSVPGNPRAYYPRWHETTVTLRNMIRN